MSSETRKQYWERLGARLRTFAKNGGLLRILADFVLVNVSMWLAFVLWFLFYVMVLKYDQQEVLAEKFKNFFITYWLFWSVLALLIFHLSGFYTRTRGYASRYKMWVVFRAVSLFVVLFIFSDYLLFRGALVPRGVALLGWALTLATVGGGRFAKDLFLKRYDVERKSSPTTIERVLVVGGAGYIGSVLVPDLLARGYKVRVLDSFLFGPKSLEAVKTDPNCELITGDIRDIQVVVQVMKDCDAVIHLAAIVGDLACEENRQLAVEVNRASTRMLIDIARGYGVERFIFASTCSVYGASEFLMDEHSKLGPLSTYAQTKADSEELLLEARTSGFHPTVLRLGTLFGVSPRLRFDLVVNLLTARAAAMGKITIFNGEQWRPFMHVYDAARSFVACLQASTDVVSGEIFNVGSYSLNHRLSEVAEKIAQIVPGMETEHVENTDRRDYRVSFDKIHTRLGFVCQKTLDDGIREIYELMQLGHVEDFTVKQFNNRAVVAAFARTAEAERSSLRLLEVLARYE